MNVSNYKPKTKPTDSSVEADVVEHGEGGTSEGEVLMVSFGNTKPSEEWTLDSVCTFHICPKRSWFHTYETVTDGVVMIGNNNSCPIVG